MNNQVLISLAAPVDGKFMKLSQVKDPVFSEGLMGQGFAIEPTDGKVVSPVDGTVTLVSETKHAFGIKTPDGADVLVHLGIDTVDLKGEPFTVLIKQGDRVKMGQDVVKMDLKEITDAGKQKTVILAITNSKDILQQLMTKEFDQNITAGSTVAVASIKKLIDKKPQKVGSGKYDQLAADIVENVGGTENINSLIHCITRLRFYLKDDSKANDNAIENLDGVISVAKAADSIKL